MSTESKGHNSHLVGVISDTHGLLRPEVLKAFQGIDLIVHAGDIGPEEVLKALQEVAPVFAVRGNMDRFGWTGKLSKTEVVKVGEALLYVLHDVDELDLDPAASGFSAVISGHSHRPWMEKQNGVLFLNPGSAGPCRSALPASVALLRVEGNSLGAQLIALR
ncbi:MAG: metallophosphoesterase family protein [Thermodesulfobacteriota bacterium]|nr:metallophosphoesterase family protein [Thermodesulfobacteriota bacterium]